MKTLQDKFIIGVDHGYGNMKTANHCFKTGILGYDSEPLFTGDMLIYNGRYYLKVMCHRGTRQIKWTNCPLEVSSPIVNLPKERVWAVGV